LKTKQFRGNLKDITKMAKNKKTEKSTKNATINWTTEENNFKHSFAWYAVFLTICWLFFAVSLITNNYLFSIIIIFIAVLTVANEEGPKKIKVIINEKEIKIDNIIFPLLKFNSFNFIDRKGESHCLKIGFKNGLKSPLLIPFEKKETEKEKLKTKIRETLLNAGLTEFEETEESLLEKLKSFLRF